VLDFFHKRLELKEGIEGALPRVAGNTGIFRVFDKPFFSGEIRLNHYREICIPTAASMAALTAHPILLPIERPQELEGGIMSREMTVEALAILRGLCYSDLFGIVTGLFGKESHIRVAVRRIFPDVVLISDIRR
jgi:hypothetical protein